MTSLLHPLEQHDESSSSEESTSRGAATRPLYGGTATTTTTSPPLVDVDPSESSSHYYIFEDDRSDTGGSLSLLPPDGGAYGMLALRYRSLESEESDSSTTDGAARRMPPPPPVEQAPSRRRRRLFAKNNNHHVTSRSAVDIRNQSFQEWEVQAAPRSLLSSSWRRLSERQSPSAKTISTQSVTSSVVASIMKEQRKREKATARQAIAVCQDGLESRMTADTVATALSLGDDAQGLLEALRGRTGAIEMEEPYGFDGLPYLHVAGDVWIPHYEEYVVKMVLKY